MTDNDQWMTDVWTEPEWEQQAINIHNAKRDARLRRNAPPISRKPVWPPEPGITVMVEMTGTYPLVHVLHQTLFGIKTAACGVSPPSTDHKSQSLVVEGFSACRHCWDRA